MSISKILATVSVFVVGGTYLLKAQTNLLPASGNVGIGTTSPQGLLTIQNLHANGQANEVFTLNDPINPHSFNITKYDRVIGGYWNSDIRFNLNQSGVINNTVMTLASSGNVGIGTTSPPGLLTIQNLHANGQANEVFTLNDPINPRSFNITKYDRVIGGYWNSDIRFNLNQAGVINNTVMTLASSGNVGIGTTSPQGLLTIQNLHVDGQANEVFTLNDPINPHSFNITKYDRVIGNYWNSDIRFNLNQAGVINNTVMLLSSNGSVGIGTTNTYGYKLAVNGTIGAKDIVVETTNFPDYVFADHYCLRSLDELDTYIAAHHHLPNLPTASEAASEGVSVGELQNKLLEKIEELTLYVMAQNKKMTAQARQIAEQQQAIADLKNSIARLK